MYISERLISWISLAVFGGLLLLQGAGPATAQDGPRDVHSVHHRHHVQEAGPPTAQDGANSDDPYADRSVGEAYTEDAQGNLRVGLAEADITPTWPVQMLYGADDETTEFYDRTKAKILILEASGEKFAVIEYDIIGIEKEAAEFIKEYVEERTGLEKRHIILAGTHNHSYTSTRNDRVRDFIAEKTVKAVSEAEDNMFSGRIGIGKKNVREDLNLNRALLDGESNSRLYVMRIEDQDGHLRGVHYNFGAHPTIFTEWGSTQGWIGPEWPGYVNRYVHMRKKLDLLHQRYENKVNVAADPWVMFSEGAAGDQQPRRSDIQILGKREPSSKVFGEKLAWEVLNLTENIETTPTVDLEMSSKVIELNRKNGEVYQTLLQTLAINNSLIATIPGEFNVGLAHDYIEKSPYENNILITLAEDGIGYIVQEHLAWEEVTYQAKSVSFEPHYAEQIIDESLKLVDPSHEVRPKGDPSAVLGSISGTVDYEGDETVAVGAKRMPSGPNYAGGFWGRRTVINEDGSWEIDSLAPGQLYLYVVETDAQQPRPPEFKSGYEDVKDLVIGYPVNVKPQKETKNINFEFPEDYMETNVESIELNDESLRVDGYTLSGKIDVEGSVSSDEEVVVGVYPAKLMYRSLNSYLREPVLTTVANEDGEFTFNSLPPGEYRVVSYIDINNNDLQEGIDITTRPEDSPVISIKGSLENNAIDSPYQGSSEVIFNDR